MAIKGNARETVSFEKQVGVFEGKVVAINPTKEELEKIYGSTIENEIEYTGEKEVNVGTKEEPEMRMVKTAKVVVYLKDVKTGALFNTTFYLEDRQRPLSKKGLTQYIDNIGNTSWAKDESDLKPWFTKRPYRKAMNGEDTLYEFATKWFNLTYKDIQTELDLEYDKMMNGNFSILKNSVGSDITQTITALATVKTVEKEGEVKEYQQVYNRQFLPGYAIKTFRTKKFTEEVVNEIRGRKEKDVKSLKPIDKFVLSVTDEEYPLDAFFSLDELHAYDPSKNLVASNSAKLEEDNSDY